MGPLGKTVLSTKWKDGRVWGGGGGSGAAPKGEENNKVRR